MIIGGKEEQEGITDPEDIITTNVHVPDQTASNSLK